MKRTIRLRVVRSSVYAGMLSVRLVDAAEGDDTRNLRAALSDAGYEEGDIVILTPADGAS